MFDALRHVDRIPWPITAISGLLGFLVLLRYLHLHLTGMGTNGN